VSKYRNRPIAVVIRWTTGGAPNGSSTLTGNLHRPGLVQRANHCVVVRLFHETSWSAHRSRWLIAIYLILSHQADKHRKLVLIGSLCGATGDNVRDRQYRWKPEGAEMPGCSLHTSGSKKKKP